MTSSKAASGRTSHARREEARHQDREWKAQVYCHKNDTLRVPGSVWHLRAFASMVAANICVCVHSIFWLERAAFINKSGTAAMDARVAAVVVISHAPAVNVAGVAEGKAPVYVSSIALCLLSKARVAKALSAPLVVDAGLVHQFAVRTCLLVNDSTALRGVEAIGVVPPRSNPVGQCF